MCSLYNARNVINYLYTCDLYMYGMKSKMSGNFTLSRRFETFLVLFLYRETQGTNISFFPQYYFSVKLNAKKRQVKIRFSPPFWGVKVTFTPRNGGEK